MGEMQSASEVSLTYSMFTLSSGLHIILHLHHPLTIPSNSYDLSAVSNWIYAGCKTFEIFDTMSISSTVMQDGTVASHLRGSIAVSLYAVCEFPGGIITCIELCISRAPRPPPTLASFLRHRNARIHHARHQCPEEAGGFPWHRSIQDSRPPNMIAVHFV